MSYIEQSELIPKLIAERDAALSEVASLRRAHEKLTTTYLEMLNHAEEMRSERDAAIALADTIRTRVNVLEAALRSIESCERLRAKPGAPYSHVWDLARAALAEPSEREETGG